MEMDDETQLVSSRNIMTWEQMLAFVDPVMVLNDEKDRAVMSVESETKRLGLTIESMEVHVEIYVKAYAK